MEFLSHFLHLILSFVVGIYVKFVGFCKVHWTTTESRRVDDRDVTYTVVHESYEEYCNMKIYLVGGESGTHLTII